MTPSPARNLHKLNGNLVHLALEVEARTNDARKDYFLEQMLQMTGKKVAK